jgi:pyrimidine-nucleoside phosphorylase
MRAVDIIVKKRDRGELSREEIDFFVHGFNREEIPDYQAAAWAMAVMLNGMSDQETTDLTLAMAHSGDMLDLSEVVPIAVDKHSTGGVGDKTTMVIGPLVAACGLAVGKMSGRGLGFSGGTLDKLESIPGFRTDLTLSEFRNQLKNQGVVVNGQTSDLAPADGKLYALRDVTGTVPSIPLIASSVMSKKIAAGAHAILLDVKIGQGAFMENLEDAHRLARLMVSIGTLSGRKVVALISDMNQPLGYAVGNALEIVESIETLHGNGPHDFQEHCLEVSSQMLVLGKKANNLDEARQMCDQALSSGRAWEKFRVLVMAQGGNVDSVDHPERLPTARLIETVKAPQSGWLSAIQAREVGETAVDLGAGRARKGDSIDHAVGIVIHGKVGDRLKAGDDLFTVHANDQQRLEAAKSRLLAAHEWSEQECDPLPLFYGVID